VQVATSDSDLSPSASHVQGLLTHVVDELGGVHRVGQNNMAAEVIDAMDNGRHLLVQAGTGTGKSLGYLVPAMAHAVSAGKRVIVSTATLALQRQLVNRDIPLVATSLERELPRPAQVVLLKGRQNYVCKNKLHGGFPAETETLFDVVDPQAGEDHEEQGASSLGQEVVRLRKWAEETDTGDRDDLIPGVSDRAWRQVSVTALECLGASRCPMAQECFSEQARRDSHEADVVVTNHAMLALSMTPAQSVLPEHDVVIVDEAHELTQRVTSAITGELSAPAVSSAARSARRNAGLTTASLDDAGTALEKALQQVEPSWFRDGLPEELLGAVDQVDLAARDLLSALRADRTGGSKGSSDQADGHKQVAYAAVEAIAEIAQRLLSADQHDVVWTTGPSAWSDRVPTVHIAPLSVAGMLNETLLEKETAIFTSATLKLGGDFDVAARGFGLFQAEGEAWRGVDVGSPFEYGRQGILYVASHLPRPSADRAAVHAELREIITASRGGVLGLFSSRRAAEDAADTLRELVDVPILCQGDDSLPSLVREFSEDFETCLFGTISLWQGVDVPGQNARVVTIDRLPFPRPDDPISQARSAAVEASGGNGFMAVSVHHAALLLAQGAGRLIRTSKDQGVVAVLDSRLVKSGYGKFLTQSLPPLWRTTNQKVTLSALERLASSKNQG